MKNEAKKGHKTRQPRARQTLSLQLAALTFCSTFGSLHHTIRDILRSRAQSELHNNCTKCNSQCIRNAVRSTYAIFTTQTSVTSRGKNNLNARRNIFHAHYEQANKHSLSHSEPNGWINFGIVLLSTIPHTHTHLLVSLPQFVSVIVSHST